MHETFGNSAIKELGLDAERIRNCMQSAFFAKGGDVADPALDDNSLLERESQKVRDLAVHSSIPMIKINGVVYEGSVRSQLFIQFACENDLIDCRSTKQ